MYNPIPAETTMIAQKFYNIQLWEINNGNFVAAELLQYPEQSTVALASNETLAVLFK